MQSISTDCKGRTKAREWPFRQISILQPSSKIKLIVEESIGHMPKDTLVLVALIATYADGLLICSVSKA